MNNLQEVQADMRKGYGDGSIGVFISGIVWVTASIMVQYYTSQKGIWTLLIGGMLIFPLATLVGRLIGVKGAHAKNNPLGKLVMEGTIWMIMSIPLAYGLSLIKTEWFFQGMLLIIAGRYMTFASIYGLRIYYILASVLGLTAYVLFKRETEASISALAGGLIELLFGVVIYVRYKSDKQKIEDNIS